MLCQIKTWFFVKIRSPGNFNFYVEKLLWNIHAFNINPLVVNFNKKKYIYSHAYVVKFILLKKYVLCKFHKFKFNNFLVI